MKVKNEIHMQDCCESKDSFGGCSGIIGQFYTVHLNNWVHLKWFALSSVCFLVCYYKKGCSSLCSLEVFVYLWSKHYQIASVGVGSPKQACSECQRASEQVGCLGKFSLAPMEVGGGEQGGQGRGPRRGVLHRILLLVSLEITLAILPIL